MEAKEKQNNDTEKIRPKVRKRTIFGTAVEIWRYRFITMLLLIIPSRFFDNTMELLINSSGSAVTTANITDGRRQPCIPGDRSGFQVHPEIFHPARFSFGIFYRCGCSSVRHWLFNQPNGVLIYSQFHHQRDFLEPYLQSFVFRSHSCHDLFCVPMGIYISCDAS